MISCEDKNMKNESMRYAAALKQNDKNAHDTHIHIRINIQTETISHTTIRLL